MDLQCIFRYDDKDDDDLCKSGLSVLTGSGCCRRVADFLSNIYYELEVNVYDGLYYSIFKLGHDI